MELAHTAEERRVGLMYRRQLDADKGMLFDFGPPQEVAMWMSNTYIPLDMLFIRADGTIHRIAADTVPFSTDVIGSKGKVTSVLELNAGTARRLGIKPGDKVVHPMFRAD